MPANVLLKRGEKRYVLSGTVINGPGCLLLTNLFKKFNNRTKTDEIFFLHDVINTYRIFSLYYFHYTTILFK